MTEKDISVIPLGLYCYGPKGQCYYHSIIYPGIGFCSFLEESDWSLSVGLLFDSVKECSVNMDWENE